jgi:hypothetical protein
MKNRIFAIEAAPAAIPKKPKTPAIIAIIRNMTVQRNIIIVFKLNNLFTFKGPVSYHFTMVLKNPCRKLLKLKIG